MYIYEINCALADVILWNEVNNLALKDARSSRVFPTCEVDTNLTAHSANTQLGLTNAQYSGSA